MQRSTYNKNARKKVCRFLAVLSSVILIPGLIVGTTLAYMVDREGPLTNTFMPSTVDVFIDETFENDVKTNVYVKNTGDTEAYIRAAVVVTWKDEDGNVYPQMPVVGKDYEIIYNLGTAGNKLCWIEGSDGFYYYTSPVADNASTDVLISTCSPIDENAPMGYGLNVEILASAIQSVPVSVVEEKWGVTSSEITEGMTTITLISK